MTVPALPLDGVRVLDFTQVMSGPYCTRLMVEAGAEVIKVEPIDGELVRHRPPLVDGRSRYFGQLNAGKRSVALDLRRAEIQPLLKRAVAGVDVVVENFRPGVMARFGLGSEHCMALNPSLVYCSISGFGQTGSAAARPAVAPVVHAASGLDAALMNHLGTTVPPTSGVFTADVLAGALAFGQISAALRAVGEAGEGRALDVSMDDAVLGLLVHEMQEAQVDGPLPSPAYEPSRTADGYVMAAIVTRRHLEALADVLNDPDLALDPDFATAEARRFNTTTLRQRIEKWSSQHPTDHVEAILQQANIPCSRYRDARERLTDEALWVRGTLYRARDGAGEFTSVSSLPSTVRSDSMRHVRDLGADTSMFLHDTCGVDMAEIHRLHDDECILAAEVNAGLA